MQTLESAEPGRAPLGLWDTVSIIVGIVIGAGIYETPPFVFSSFSSGGLGLLAWIMGGVLALIGALCYAELATTYPRSGGDYVYLTRAYGSFVGFLFGWAQLSVVLTANIGMMAYVFADYAAQLVPLDSTGKLWTAGLSIVVLTALNMVGVVVGKTVQNLLTIVKFLGLAAIVVAGLFFKIEHPAAVAPPAGITTTLAGFAGAMVLVLLTYGGWNDAAFIAAEVRNKQRDIPRALIAGVAIITAVYLTVNVAYLRVLGLAGVQQSQAVAADTMQAAMGEWGSRFIAVLVMISALGAINGLIFAGARVCAGLGGDHAIFAWLSGWNSKRGSPIPALLAQAAIALAMLLAVGSELGQSGLGQAFAAVGLSVKDWAGRSGFETLLKCTAPVFWAFFLLTSISLFVLRRKDPGLARPFGVPLFPLTPVLFSLTCGAMLYSGITYASSFGLVGAAIVLAGAPLYVISRRLDRSRGVQRSSDS